MNERNLRCFTKVYELGSIRRAAKELYLSAQAISKVISRMEDELGQDLFIRSKNGLYPTEFADRLKERADIILYQYQEIKKDFTGQTKDNIYVLRIASAYAVLKYLTLDFLKGFYDKYPNIRLNVVEYPEYPIYGMLEKGQLDLAFLPEPIDPNLFEFIFCFSHKYCAVMNVKHPLVAKEVLEYQDLIDIPLAMKGREYVTFPGNLSRFLKGGLNPDIQIETSEDSLIVEAAEKEWCIGITADFLAKEYANDNIAIRPFSDEKFERSIFLTWRKAHKMTQATLDFIDYMKMWSKEHQ